MKHINAFAILFFSLFSIAHSEENKTPIKVQGKLHIVDQSGEIARADWQHTPTVMFEGHNEDLLEINNGFFEKTLTSNRWRSNGMLKTQNSIATNVVVNIEGFPTDNYVLLSDIADYSKSVEVKFDNGRKTQDRDIELWYRNKKNATSFLYAKCSSKFPYSEKMPIEDAINLSKCLNRVTDLSDRFSVYQTLGAVQEQLEKWTECKSSFQKARNEAKDSETRDRQTSRMISCAHHETESFATNTKHDETSVRAMWQKLLTDSTEALGEVKPITGKNRANITNTAMVALYNYYNIHDREISALATAIKQSDKNEQVLWTNFVKTYSGKPYNKNEHLAKIEEILARINIQLGSVSKNESTSL